MFKVFVFFAFSFFLYASTEEVVRFQAVARKEGKTIYTEKHELIYSKEKLKSSRTFYFTPDNKHFATEKNLFLSGGYAFPESKIYYPKDPETYEGSKIEKNFYIIYRKKKSSPFEQKLYEKEGLMITGQGIHYYLQENLEVIKANESLSFKYFIPNKLDYYTFQYNFIKEVDDKYYFKIEISNWLFSLMAPSFDVIYDKKSKKIIYYKGISPWTDKQGELQMVEVNYLYE